jgi:hypothetical protein
MVSNLKTAKLTLPNDTKISLKTISLCKLFLDKFLDEKNYGADL